MVFCDIVIIYDFCTNTSSHSHYPGCYWFYCFCVHLHEKEERQKSRLPISWFLRSGNNFIIRKVFWYFSRDIWYVLLCAHRTVSYTVFSFSFFLPCSISLWACSVFTWCGALFFVSFRYPVVCATYMVHLVYTFYAYFYWHMRITFYWISYDDTCSAQ